MFRALALTSTAALCLLGSACGEGDEQDSPDVQPRDTRSSVTGTHPVRMTIFSTAMLEASPPLNPSLELTAEGGSRDRLRVSLSPLDCDLTATMTGASTFALNPGTCGWIIPPSEGKFACGITLDITQGTGGRDTADGKVGVTLNANYRLRCADDDEPFITPVIVTLEED
ncbi:MAG: hypothetical protein EOO70_01110 [Myxococcaceae bacterium]|nr:MAG: hypothetical protein EOO70_01110 [Myxococcaceae bacterium]